VLAEEDEGEDHRPGLKVEVAGLLGEKPREEEDQKGVEVGASRPQGHQGAHAEGKVPDLGQGLPEEPPPRVEDGEGGEGLEEARGMRQGEKHGPHGEEEGEEGEGKGEEEVLAVGGRFFTRLLRAF